MERIFLKEAAAFVSRCMVYPGLVANCSAPLESGAASLLLDKVTGKLKTNPSQSKAISLMFDGRVTSMPGTTALPLCWAFGKMYFIDGGSSSTPGNECLNPAWLVQRCAATADATEDVPSMSMQTKEAVFKLKCSNGPLVTKVYDIKFRLYTLTAADLQPNTTLSRPKLQFEGLQEAVVADTRKAIAQCKKDAKSLSQANYGDRQV